MTARVTQEGPGLPGALRALAGESEGALAPSLKIPGGHVGAPHEK